MNPKRQRIKDGRRARKLADEAWEAAHAGNLDLAEKVIRRAVAAQPHNPVLWSDQGVLLAQRQKDAEAAESFRTAISLAPTFAEPYAHLAALRARHGFTKEAVTLQNQAVKHAPDNASFAEKLEAYRALAGQEDPETSAAQPVEEHVSPAAQSSGIELQERLDGLDWHGLSNQLTRDGCVLIAELLDPQTCAQLCSLFDDEGRFAKTVVMDRPEFGLGVYRYFRAPIPDVVDQLRRAVYPHVAAVANFWQHLLGESERFPEEWSAFADECRQAGQTTPTPILLKYGPGGFNSLHRDLRGSVFFPIQMAVVLSPGADPDDFASEGFVAASSYSATCRWGRRRGVAKSRPDWAMRCCFAHGTDS